MVTVTLNGVGELIGVTITPGAFDGSDADDLTDLGDLIVAAYRDAKAKADDARRAGPRPAGRRRLGGDRSRALAGCQAASVYEGVVQDLIDELGRLPGVGPKSAQRIAFHLLQADPADVRRLADVLVEVKAKGGSARSAATSPRTSSAGSAATRAATRRVICVVEEPKDVVAIERTREFRGRYHVLGGAISPDRGHRARRSCASAS